MKLIDGHPDLGDRWCSLQLEADEDLLHAMCLLAAADEIWVAGGERSSTISCVSYDSAKPAVQLVCHSGVAPDLHESGVLFLERHSRFNLRKAHREEAYFERLKTACDPRGFARTAVFIVADGLSAVSLATPDMIFVREKLEPEEDICDDGVKGMIRRHVDSSVVTSVLLVGSSPVFDEMLKSDRKFTAIRFTSGFQLSQDLLRDPLNLACVVKLSIWRHLLCVDELASEFEIELPWDPSPEIKELLKLRSELFIRFVFASLKEWMLALEPDRFEKILRVVEKITPFLDPRKSVAFILSPEMKLNFEEQIFVALRFFNILAPQIFHGGTSEVDRTACVVPCRDALLRSIAGCDQWLEANRFEFASHVADFTDFFDVGNDVTPSTTSLVACLLHKQFMDLEMNEFLSPDERRTITRLVGAVSRTEWNVLNAIWVSTEIETQLGLGCLIYLSRVEGVLPTLIPSVYLPGFVLRSLARILPQMLAHSSTHSAKKAIGLIDHHCSSVFESGSFDRNYAEVPEILNVFSELFKVMCFRNDEGQRIRAKDSFAKLLDKFDVGARTSIYSQLLKRERQPGVREFLILEVKKSFLSGAVEFGKPLHRLLLNAFSALKGRVDEQVTSGAPWLLTAMSFLRLLSREPHRTKAGLDATFEAIATQFLKPVAERMRASHKTLTSEMTDLSAGVGKMASVDSTVEIAGRGTLKEPTPGEKRQNLEMSLTTVALLRMCMKDLVEDLQRMPPEFASKIPAEVLGC